MRYGEVRHDTVQWAAMIYQGGAVLPTALSLTLLFWSHEPTDVRPCCHRQLLWWSYLEIAPSEAVAQFQNILSCLRRTGGFWPKGTQHLYLSYLPPDIYAANLGSFWEGTNDSTERS